MRLGRGCWRKDRLGREYPDQKDTLGSNRVSRTLLCRYSMGRLGTTPAIQLFYDTFCVALLGNLLLATALSWPKKAGTGLDATNIQPKQAMLMVAT